MSPANLSISILILIRKLSIMKKDTKLSWNQLDSQILICLILNLRARAVGIECLSHSCLLIKELREDLLRFLEVGPQMIQIWWVKLILAGPKHTRFTISNLIFPTKNAILLVTVIFHTLRNKKINQRNMKINQPS